MSTWIIQSNLIRNDQTFPLVDSLIHNGINFVDVAVIPFSNEPLDIKSDDSIWIPYGSTKLSKIALQENWLGLFFDEETFRVDCWNKNHNNMLNNDSIIMTIKDAYDFMSKYYNEYWFIRPINDFKAFAGEVISGEDFISWIQTASSGGYTFTDMQEISIARPKNIQAEWRYFIVDRKIIDGSMYRLNNRMYKQHETDEDVIIEAQRQADIWLPHDNCVMDLALVDNKIKVVEFNCLNSSGFYDHDLDKIVSSVTDYCDNKIFFEED
ncbi:MAG: ATP-grasp domain-containing protein [Flavobacterium sp.]|uniref:ATP-grasp domain-containing protein n=1 Tax=Flavobacterium sp. TaxID=239 RepID=UPI002625D8F4|nr:ATP-grasp domain-containing protein [Flavobacterium sp.]MDD5150659.1 ATP-grasp domain-containing protein [Flavobacterium sp.]